MGESAITNYLQQIERDLEGPKQRNSSTMLAVVILSPSVKLLSKFKFLSLFGKRILTHDQ